MKLDTTHEILVLGPDYGTCKQHVLRFFNKTPLVRYDAVHVRQEKSLPATDADFWPRVEAGMGKNEQALNELLGELKGYGFTALDDLRSIDQGFQSKILHTAAHLLDGFFGIDTCFYSLVHDSHRLTDEQCQEIQNNPEDYWLLYIKGVLAVKSGGKPAFLRSFEK